MLTSFSQSLIRQRLLVILAVIMLVGAAASGGRWLRFRNDYRMFFSEDNPHRQAFEHVQSTYTRNDNVLFVIAPKDGRVFSNRVLAAVEQLTHDAWQIPYCSRVDSITNFQYSYAQGDHLIVNDLVRDASQFTGADVARVREVALSQPLLLNRLISPRGDVTGVNVTVRLPGIDESREVPSVAAFARQVAQKLRSQHVNLDVYVTGLVMMNSAFSECSARDMATLVPLMLLTLIVLTGLLLRTISGPIVTLLVIGLAVVVAMGLAGWLGIALSPTSAAAPNIILTVAVAYCVHMLATFLHEMRSGQNKHAAMIQSLRINMWPLSLSSFTTIIGFLSMNFSDAPPFRDLGNITAIGVATAFVLSVTFLPAVMMLLPVRVIPEPGGGHRAMGRLAEFIIRRRIALLAGFTLVALGLISLVPMNELNDEFVKYFDRRVEFRRATEFTTEHLTGIYYVDYPLDSGESGGVSTPTFLANVEAFADWCRRQPEVIHVNTITDIFKRLNKNMHRDTPSSYRLPETRRLAAQYLLLYEMSLPYGLDLNDQINMDKSATRVSVTLHSLSSRQVLAFEQRAQSWLHTNSPATMRVPGSSPTIMFAHIGQRNIKSMLRGVSLALVLISLLLIIALRSLKIGLVSLIPNLVPAAVSFGLWGLLVGRVGLSLSVVAGMTLGIIVDDTVHFLSKYVRARREYGADAADAVRYAVATVGTAMWVTSVALIAGFLVLGLSAFEINSGMGVLTAIVIAVALAADLFLLPCLLLTIEPARAAVNPKTRNNKPKEVHHEADGLTRVLPKPNAL